MQMSSGFYSPERELSENEEVPIISRSRKDFVNPLRLKIKALRIIWTLKLGKQSTFSKKRSCFSSDDSILFYVHVHYTSLF